MNTSVRDDFYREVIEETGYSQKRVKSILQSRYQTFEIAKIPEYKEVVLGVYNKEQEEAAITRVKNFKQPEPVPCPVCGAPTTGDTKLFGRFTRTEGWRCTVGGSAHYWQWRGERSIDTMKQKEVSDATVEDTRESG